MDMNRIVIGISGCSASGKSFIVKYILDNLGDELVSIIEEVYADEEFSTVAFKEEKRENFLPECAVKTVEREAGIKNVTIDFGDGCTMKNDKVIKAWQLNERHYGSLQGLDKKETAIKYGEEQVFLWRRSYSTTPPLLDKDSLENPNTSTMYQDIEEVLPLGESLHDVRVRVEPILDKILASAQSNKVLVVAHGNSIRAIQKILENIPDDEISHVNIPTCIPLAFDVSVKSGKRVVKCIGYLGDSEEVLRATKEVEQQSQINNKRD